MMTQILGGVFAAAIVIAVVCAVVFFIRRRLPESRASDDAKGRVPRTWRSY